MVKIINKEKLIENGETSDIRRGRDLALQCLEQAVNAADPKRLIKAKVKVKSGKIRTKSQITNFRTGVQVLLMVIKSTFRVWEVTLTLSSRR